MKNRTRLIVLTSAALVSALVIGFLVLSKVTFSGPGSLLVPASIYQLQAPQTEEQAFQPPKDGAVIAGWVKYTGPPVTPVDPKTIKTMEDKITAYTDSLVVNPNGTLCNVLVYVKAGLQRKSFVAPAKPVVMDATPIDFFPHVLAVQAGQNVHLRNCDVAIHNWDIRSIANPPTSFGQPKVGMARYLRFMVPEVPIPVTSAIYPYMSGYICVIGHPYSNRDQFGGCLSIGRSAARHLPD